MYRNKNFTPAYDPKDPMVTYFQTHQPPEWMRDPGSRQAFERLYGGMALLILDSTAKVPENIEEVWVQAPAVLIDMGDMIKPEDVKGPTRQATDFEKYVISSLEAIKSKLGI